MFPTFAETPVVDHSYQLKDIQYHYAQQRALNIETLNIRAGAVTALVGPNGSGKSTLLSILALIRQPSHGHVKFFQERIENRNLDINRKRIGLIQQNPYLLRGSVRKNVELGLRLRGRVKPEGVQTTDQVMQKLGIAMLVARSVSHLSGGEAQRVALARSLVLEPEVLLLDEPFTHLDKGSYQEIETIIDDYAHAQKRTVVFSSHDRLRSQLIADEVFSVVDGRVIKSSLVNLYKGQVDKQNRVFDTGNLHIRLPNVSSLGMHLAIEPAQIVLSHAPLDSSMRNAFEGRIVGLVEESGQVRVTVQTGEQFEVLVTRDSVSLQQLGLGSKVWLSFKSSAVQIF
ncbi:ATP-binding cassette domain-containing protein [Pseudomonadota bacterium]